MKFERVFLVAFNALARLLGVLALLVGIVFLISAVLVPEYRLAYAIGGIFACATGVGLLIAKRVTPDQLDKFRS